MEVSRFDDAIAAFRHALSLAAGAPRILSNLGAALARAGQTEAARETLAEAMRRAPGALEPVSNLATLEAEEGDPSMAKVLAQQVLAKAPHHLVAWIALANAEQKLNNPEEAERLVRQALTLHPDNGQVLLSLASVLADLGRNGEAMEFYRQVLRQNRANPKALTGLARAHIAVDEFDAARDLLHEALQVAPDWVASRMELALLEASLGRFEQVAPHWAWRFRAENQRQRRPLPQPAWDGVCRSGQKLVLWAEQGVGDEVLWLSLVPDLLAAGMRLVIECDARLRDLLCRSFPAATVVARRDPPDPACLEVEAVQSSLAELFLHIPHSARDGAARLFPRRWRQGGPVAATASDSRWGQAADWTVVAIQCGQLRQEQIAVVGSVAGHPVRARRQLRRVAIWRYRRRSGGSRSGDRDTGVAGQRHRHRHHERSGWFRRLGRGHGQGDHHQQHHGPFRRGAGGGNPRTAAQGAGTAMVLRRQRADEPVVWYFAPPSSIGAGSLGRRARIGSAGGISLTGVRLAASGRRDRR